MLLSGVGSQEPAHDLQVRAQAGARLEQYPMIRPWQVSPLAQHPIRANDREVAGLVMSKCGQPLVLWRLAIYVGRCHAGLLKRSHEPATLGHARSKQQSWSAVRI